MIRTESIFLFYNNIIMLIEVVEVTVQIEV